MPKAVITRGPTANVEAAITNAHPDAVVDRELTGRVTGRLDIFEPGEP